MDIENNVSTVRKNTKTKFTLFKYIVPNQNNSYDICTTILWNKFKQLLLFLYWSRTIEKT